MIYLYNTIRGSGSLSLQRKYTTILNLKIYSTTNKISHVIFQTGTCYHSVYYFKVTYIPHLSNENCCFQESFLV